MGNANSGRRKAHPALTVLRGNPGRRRAPAPSVRLAGPVLAPADLSAEAAAVWAELAPLAIGLGTLTPADARAFGALCELQATLQGICRRKGPEGFGAPVEGDDGVVRLHPLLRAERETAGALRLYYALFGLEPGARARLAAPAAAVGVDRWA